MSALRRDQARFDENPDAVGAGHLLIVLIGLPDLAKPWWAFAKSVRDKGKASIEKKIEPRVSWLFGLLPLFPRSEEI